MKQLILLTLITCSGFMVHAQNSAFDTTAYEAKEISNGEHSLGYRILYPKKMVDGQKYPLVLFLHGMGERGSDNSSQLIHGGRLFLDSLEQYPSVVVFPQCPITDTWTNFRSSEGGPTITPSMELILTLIDELLAESYIDPNRFYVSGLSMGGYATWELLWRIPEKIAVALPICGGGIVDKTIHMTDVPIWAFHGAEDNVVPTRRSIQMVKGVQQNGGKAKITIYPEVGHNSWTNAFNEPEYLKWMFDQRK
ncbi:carboxylesterase family protein [Membranihabitans marinus]|uniref:carboxylesterase family protein n=1 Tax=Membranihabitans marinus TaxID=1227546 RepID=UPI001F2B59D2|nr:dienelactone hydrolase family protein [Membranihabitans marinus]